MIIVLVQWQKDDEIDQAQKLCNEITEWLRDRDLFTGMRTVNDPPKTFGAITRITPSQTSEGTATCFVLNVIKSWE